MSYSKVSIPAYIQPYIILATFYESVTEDFGGHIGWRKYLYECTSLGL